jgi:hypothetical protein
MPVLVGFGRSLSATGDLKMEGIISHGGSSAAILFPSRSSMSHASKRTWLLSGWRSSVTPAHMVELAPSIMDSGAWYDSRNSSIYFIHGN